MFRNAYDVVRGVVIECSEKSLTQQQYKDEVDINRMLEKFKITGNLPGPVRLPQYGDFTGISDFRSAMDATLKARNEFMALPLDVRIKFGHDPQRFLEFCSDEKNIDELRKMGLAPVVEVPQPLEVKVVNPPSSGA